MLYVLLFLKRGVSGFRALKPSLYFQRLVKGLGSSLNSVDHIEVFEGKASIEVLRAVEQADLWTLGHQAYFTL